MRLTDQARLLPWVGPEGKPCYLAGDGSGYLSRLADSMESAQLGLADELVREARRVLDERQWTPGELHLLAVQLMEALTCVHRIAVSRGARLPTPAYEDLDSLVEPDDEGDTPGSARRPPETLMETPARTPDGPPPGTGRTTARRRRTTAGPPPGPH